MNRINSYDISKLSFHDIKELEENYISQVKNKNIKKLDIKINENDLLINIEPYYLKSDKWDELNLSKIHDLSTSQLFDKSGKFLSYYNQIKLFDFHQTLNFISSFQELDIDFYNHSNFNEFFNDQNSFLILTAPDHDFDVNYIYEYVIISLPKDLKVLQNP